MLAQRAGMSRETESGRGPGYSLAWGTQATGWPWSPGLAERRHRGVGLSSSFMGLNVDGHERFGDMKKDFVSDAMEPAEEILEDWYQ